MANRIELHIGEDIVIPLQFRPRLKSKKRHRWLPARREVVGYEDQTYFEMQKDLCEPYGLDQEWGFRLQQPEQLWVFIPMKGAFAGKHPALSVGGIFPQLTLPVSLKAHGGMAIALIEFTVPVDLMALEGRITLFAEKSRSA